MFPKSNDPLDEFLMGIVNLANSETNKQLSPYIGKYVRIRKGNVKTSGTLRKLEKANLYVVIIGSDIVAEFSFIDVVTIEKGVTEATIVLM